MCAIYNAVPIPAIWLYLAFISKGVDGKERKDHSECELFAGYDKDDLYALVRYSGIELSNIVR